MRIVRSDNLNKLRPYLFFELERRVTEKMARGETVYDLSLGDSDLPIPPQIVKVMNNAVMKRENQMYPSTTGEPFFKEAVAGWYRKRFGVKLDPSKEVCALIGSKEGLSNIARAFVNTGDSVLVPDPAYPVYANGATILSGGDPVSMPLLEENDFLPELKTINPFNIKLMYLNYPNNPTGAIADKKFLKEAVDYAKAHGIIICYDNAYSEICYKGSSPSILEIPDAKECCVEFNSCSKSFNMTGCRVGFAVGNADVLTALAKVKSQTDSGVPIYVQKGVAAALSLYKNRSPPTIVKKNVEIYRRRMKLLTEGLNDIGWDCRQSPATFYLWARVKGSSLDHAAKLLDKGVVVAPGIGFGANGEGYLRFALTKDEKTLQKVIEKMKE